MTDTNRKPRANKTDPGNGSYGICRVIDASRSPSPDPRRSGIRTRSSAKPKSTFAQDANGCILSAMNVDELAPEVLKLPIRDRAFLAAFLWESLDDPYALTSDLDDEEALALAEARDEEIESGAITPLSHSELMARLRA